MSPDPPREKPSATSRDDDGHGPPEGFFVTHWDNDNDEEESYELDIESGSESEFTDEDEYVHPQRRAMLEAQRHADEEGRDANEDPSTRTRGHYQLLIPFPPSEIVDSEDNQGQDELPTLSTLISAEGVVGENTVNDDIPEDAEELEEDSGQVIGTDGKRDIQLTEEHVETIKNAMQNFSLPSESIPEWANELGSDDAWKDKLFQNIDKKNGAAN